ncbi:MAG: RNA polymerase-binding protein DksA [Gammaproteobacteria bacterium]
MNKEQLEFFKTLLLELEKETMAHIDVVRKELSELSNEPADEVDLASREEERMIKLRIIERETKLLPKIRYSLKQISEENYGYCEETGEPIGIERLLLRPTARFSVDSKTFMEIKEKEFREN